MNEITKIWLKGGVNFQETVLGGRFRAEILSRKNQAANLILGFSIFFFLQKGIGIIILHLFSCNMLHVNHNSTIVKGRDFLSEFYVFIDILRKLSLPFLSS